MKTVSKILMILLLVGSFALSAALQTIGMYAPNENITVHINNQAADHKNWIGIYPKGSSNAWANVISWKWTKGKSSVNIDGLPDGEYEARLFYNNSFALEAKTYIIVDKYAPATIGTKKTVYDVNENITIFTGGFTHKQKAWVGIYPAGSSNDWDNVLDWRWSESKSVNNTIVMDGLPKGKYEARLFLNNSFILEAKTAFNVADGAEAISNVKNTGVNQVVTVTVNKHHVPKDWVGIFKKGVEKKWGNQIAWSFVEGKNRVTINPGNKLPAGEYEVALFLDNSLDKVEASIGFVVKDGGNGNNVIKKKLILQAHSGGWGPMMAPNLIKRAHFIKSLPFSGYSVVGNSYTNLVMKRNVVLRYDAVWHELKGLKGLYPSKSNFLVIDMHYPGDLWDDAVWNKVTNNFKIVAKVAKNLGFAGVVYDDEAYDVDGIKLINYDKNGWFDYRDSHKQGPKVAYRNTNYTFLAHTDKITARFKKIMEGMVAVFPSIDVLYYHSPAEGHIAADNAGKNGRHLITGVGPEAGHELIGAMFLGLKRGLSAQASLHDMGEDYSYRTKAHFQRAYQWRKYTIASDATNDAVDATEHWRIPKADRKSWSKEISEGFMVTNLSLADPDPEFDTRNKISVNDMKTALERALDRSDEYVIFYSASSTADWEGNPGRGNAHLDWLQNPKGTRFSIDPAWMNMMKGIYNSKLK